MRWPGGRNGLPRLDPMTAFLRRTASASCLLFFLLACTGRAATTGTPPPTGSASPTSTGASPATSASQLRILPAGYRLPAPVQRAVAVSFGGSIYIAGGLDAAGNSAAGVFRLNPATGRITSIGSLPQAFHDGAGAVIGRSLFVFGGGTARSSATVQAIDLPTGRSRVAGTLPSPLSDLAAATVGSTVYVLGGWNGVTPQPTDLGDVERHRLPTRRRAPGGSPLSGGRDERYRCPGRRRRPRRRPARAEPSTASTPPPDAPRPWRACRRRSDTRWRSSRTACSTSSADVDPSGAARSSVTEVALPDGTPTAGPSAGAPARRCGGRTRRCRASPDRWVRHGDARPGLAIAPSRRRRGRHADR